MRRFAIGNHTVNPEFRVLSGPGNIIDDQGRRGHDRCPCGNWNQSMKIAWAVDFLSSGYGNESSCASWQVKGFCEMHGCMTRKLATAHFVDAG